LEYKKVNLDNPGMESCRQKGKSMHYQYLHYTFFETCRKRRISKTPMLLLIYLRGLYCRFGNIFTWKNKTIIDDLGIDRRTLQRSRLLLREKGIIKSHSGRAFLRRRLIAAE